MEERNQQDNRVQALGAFARTLSPALLKKPAIITYNGAERTVTGFREDGYFIVDDHGGGGGAAVQTVTEIPCNDETLALVWAHLGLPQVMAKGAGAGAR